MGSVHIARALAHEGMLDVESLGKMDTHTLIWVLQCKKYTVPVLELGVCLAYPELVARNINADDDEIIDWLINYGDRDSLIMLAKRSIALEKLMENEDVEVRRMVAMVDRDIAFDMIDDQSELVRVEVVKHGIYPARFAKDRSLLVRKTVAMNPANASLMKSNDYIGVRATVAKCTTDSELLNQLRNDNSAWVSGIARMKQL